MATESFTVSELIPASPERIYRAWLDASEHAAMTGGGATSEPRVGGGHTAWDGYIRGTHLELEPGRRIIQSWRSVDFPEAHADSRLEIMLEPSEGGTRLTLSHSGLPEGQGADYEEGWKDHYFLPMRKYFSTAAVEKQARSASTESETVPMPILPAIHNTLKTLRKRPEAPVKLKMKRASQKPKLKVKTKVQAAAPKAKPKAKANAKAKPKARPKAKPKAKAKPKRGRR